MKGKKSSTFNNNAEGAKLDCKLPQHTDNEWQEKDLFCYNKSLKKVTVPTFSLAIHYI